MPTFIHGKSTGVLLNQFDLSTYFNSVDTASTIDTAEITTPDGVVRLTYQQLQSLLIEDLHNRVCSHPQSVADPQGP